jgi:tripartite-type tricarboxylate transporter receptor subunit TctC
MTPASPARRGALLAAPALLLAPRRADAQGAAWPDRPVRLVVAFPAGSVTDTLMRHLSEPLGRELGQPVIVDNRPGGNGSIGTESVARAAPDGHTWCVLSTTNGALNTYTIRRLPYDPLKDFAPIGFIGDTAYILVVNAQHPARDLRGLLDLAKQRPGQLTYSHGNSSAHIASATMARLAGVQMEAVPYRGGPEALTDVIAGRIDSTFTDYPAGTPQIREGKVRALAVTTAAGFPMMPEVPPVAALLPGFDLSAWFGMAVPAATPGPIIARANTAMNKVLASPDFAERVGRLGYTPRPTEPEWFREYLRGQIERLTRQARESGLEQSG